MTIIDQKLAKLAKLLERLPADAQADVLDEIEARVTDLSRSRMTEKQRDIVKARLAEPRDYASAEEIDAFLQRYRS